MNAMTAVLENIKTPGPHSVIVRCVVRAHIKGPMDRVTVMGVLQVNIKTRTNRGAASTAPMGFIEIKMYKMDAKHVRAGSNNHTHWARNAFSALRGGTNQVSFASLAVLVTRNLIIVQEEFWVQ
jgi:hypothetical protein